MNTRLQSVVVPTWKPSAETSQAGHSGVKAVVKCTSNLKSVLGTGELALETSPKTRHGGVGQ